LLEFTGERVIPGLVDPNLLNEHVARYRFTARFAGHARVLDAGCGSGYGTAELANASTVVGIDISADAVAHARRAFSRPGVHFIQGACESLPFAGESFDLVVAFEVIEHIQGWQRMLAEARRVLRPSGVLLVSTPNKAWYNESRAAAGPNPYHVREFEYGEFKAALEAVFPHVHLWTQNHSDAIAFVPASASNGLLDAPADSAPEHAHFFLAACSQSPIAETGAFAWMPSSGNALRERLRHISLLESEIERKNEWLSEAAQSHAELQKAHENALAELHESNTWAARLNGELDVARAEISGLESEAAVRLAWIDGLETQIRDLEAQTSRGRAEIARVVLERDEMKREMESTIAERTHWAQSLDVEVDRLRTELQRVRTELGILETAKLVRVGRKLRLISSAGDLVSGGFTK
jgi:ubiquinone/menaquinone biosynthesis C-methylase UbiE